MPHGNTGLERTPNTSRYTKLTLEKKILPPLLPGFELATFRSRVRRFYLQTIPAALLLPFAVEAVGSGGAAAAKVVVLLVEDVKDDLKILSFFGRREN